MMPVQLSLVKSLGTAVKADDTRSKMAAHSHCRSKSREPFRAPIPNGISDVGATARRSRSEEHTSELQSLMRNSYAVFCLTKKKPNPQHPIPNTQKRIISTTT